MAVQHHGGIAPPGECMLIRGGKRRFLRRVRGGTTTSSNETSYTGNLRCIDGEHLSFDVALPDSFRDLNALSEAELGVLSPAVARLAGPNAGPLTAIFVITETEPETLVVVTETPGVDVLPEGEFSPQIGLGRLISTSPGGARLYRQPQIEGRHYALGMRILQQEDSGVNLTISVDGIEEHVDEYGPLLLEILDTAQVVEACA